MDTKQKLIATLHEEADEWLTERFGIDDTKMAKLIAEFTYENRQELGEDIRQMSRVATPTAILAEIVHKVKDG